MKMHVHVLEMASQGLQKTNMLGAILMHTYNDTGATLYQDRPLAIRSSPATCIYFLTNWEPSAKYITLVTLA